MTYSLAVTLYIALASALVFALVLAILWMLWDQRGMR